MKAQFKQADRLNSKYIAVLNSEDLNNNEIKIKNNKTKKEEIISLDALIYYLDEKLSEEDDCYGEECSCGDDCCGSDNCSCGGDCHHHED